MKEADQASLQAVRARAVCGGGSGAKCGTGEKDRRKRRKKDRKTQAVLAGIFGSKTAFDIMSGVQGAFFLLCFR